jgi:hypothetical protein
MLDKIISEKANYSLHAHFPPTYLIMSRDVFDKAKADEEIRARYMTYKDDHAIAIAGLIVAVIATPGVTDILTVK